MPQGRSSVDIIPFREIAARESLSIPKMLEEFCGTLADTLGLLRTSFIAVSYDHMAGKHVVLFSQGVSDIDIHKEFAAGLTDYMPAEWPLYLLGKNEVPEGLRGLLWPEALGAIRFDFDGHEETTLFFYTFDEKEKAVISQDNAEFLTAAASYAMLAFQKDIYEERMNELLYNDSLTDTPNRTYFYHMLVGAIQIADYENVSFAVLIVDITSIRAINDSYGYHIGDQVIQTVAERLKEIMDPGCILSRFSGNDFAVYIPNADNLEKVYEICRRITKSVSLPVEVGPEVLQTAVNVGISLFPHDGESVDKLLKNAEAAMFQAKKDSSVQYKLYNPAISKESGKLLSLGVELNRAIAHDEFEMYYQAQLDIKNNSIASVEALIRWRHPQRGVLPPYEFIPFAEDNGRILDIDKLVLVKVCRQAKKWHDEGQNFIIGVNISGEHFRNGEIVNSLAAALNKTGAPPQMIDIEILEGTLIEDFDTAMNVLSRIKALGVSVSLDDFGSGYSSLEYVTMLPLDFLKIDRGFAMNMDKNPRNKIIIRTIMLLAAEMNFRVIAEGVETEKQLEFLKETGCDYAQGYYINKPMPIEELESLVAKYNTAVQH